MPEYRTAAEQEAAAEKYWQSLIARERDARAVEMRDAQTLRSAQANLAQDDTRLRQVDTETRRARHAYTLR